jgi:DNA helicase-2/ATP-dependent DNA helicase PcrA
MRYTKEHSEKLVFSQTRALFQGRGPIRKIVPAADPYQEKVINAREQTIRILASAGSGKTQTILHRALKQVREGVPPGRFLIVTFDNSAVRSIVTKLREQLEGSHLSLHLFRIQTLNSLGYEILRNNFPQDYQPIVPESRRRQLFQEVKRALKKKSIDRFYELPLGIKDRFYLEFFSLLKNELFDPRALEPQRFADFILVSRQAKNFFEAATDSASVRSVIEAVGWMFKAYERVLQRERLIDFDDQKLRAYLALRENARVRRDLQGKYSEIIVDEFQDINHLDFALIKLLAEKSRLVITGDDDQAIYGFRNCSSNFIIDLEKHLNRRVASYELKINYRNPVNLVEHASKLIDHNLRRIPKDPISDLSRMAEIKVVSSLSAGSEAKLIVSIIQQIRRTTPAIRYQDFAVLYRINAQSLPLQVEFNLNNIPYLVSEHDHLLRHEALEKLLGFLRLKLCLQAGKRPSPEDAILTLKSFFRRLDASTAEGLHQLFKKNRDFYQTITSQEILIIAPKIKESRLVESVREAVNARSLRRTLAVLANRFQGMKGMIGGLDEALEDENPLAEIFDFASGFAGDTGRFVEVIETALERAREPGAGKDEENGVALLTYFKAKGLQWHSVFLTSCNEGIIPHKRASIEDERRLFYVAMTRASSNLLISYRKRNCNTAVAPSRFLAEAGL